MDKAPLGAKFEEAANDEMRRIFHDLKQLTGITVPLYIVGGGSFHGANTSGSRINMGPEYLERCIPVNFHGFEDPAFTEMQTAFVLNHEIGHITVHPGGSGGYSWLKEIRSLILIEPAEQPMWANVLSDICVNYNVSRGNNFISGTQALQDKYKDLCTKGFHHDYFIREAANVDRELSPSDPGYNYDIEVYQTMVENGTLKDNRWQPVGKDRGAYDPSDPTNDFLPTKLTPNWQLLWGRGRGAQFYPTVAACVQKNAKHPETGKPFNDAWKQVLVLATLDMKHCNDCGIYFSWQDPTAKWGAKNCPNCGGKYTKLGKVPEGKHKVLRAMTYDDRTDFSGYEPIKAYEVEIKSRMGGKKTIWVPGIYCLQIGPESGNVASSIWEWHWGMGCVNIKNQPRNQNEGSITHRRLCRFMTMLMYAGIYATNDTGFGGLTGKQAALRFMEACRYDLATLWTEELNP